MRYLRRWVKLLSAVLLGALIGVNGVAFMQVWAMTHFAESGERTARPERLSVFDKITILLSGVNIPRPQNRRTPADLRLAYETHQFASPNATPLEAWYIPGKAALPLIALFHGYAASKASLLSAAQVFHELGFPTLLVDFYGSGGSSGTGTTIGVKEASDVAAAVDYVRRTCRIANWCSTGFPWAGQPCFALLGQRRSTPMPLLLRRRSIAC